jgi:glutamate-ammonia-ligase adenylyltransferase
MPGTRKLAISYVTHSIPPDLQQGLEILLSRSADPQAVLLRLNRFCEANPSEFQQIAWTPFGLQALITVFSSSEFLSETVLRHPGWLIAILESGSLHRVRSTTEMEADLAGWVAESHPQQDEALAPLSLASFRRRQILRILVRDVLGFAALPEVTEELSNLADTIINAACRSVRTELEKKYGVPRLADGSVCGFSVLALGKLGGRELNYSSDIDLMFLYSGHGETGGVQSLTHREFFKKLANRLTELLATYTPQGMIYRVDLRLRPDGRHGEVSISLDAAKEYYEKRARDWELQMLIKARCAAGDSQPARALLEWVQPMIYSTTLDFSAVESMSESRERISDKLAARKRPGGTDVKLARGGIRDIEFLVQCLQRVHGGREVWLRNSGTLLALNRLRDKDLLSDSEYSRLVNAYQFLRHLEHRLQFAEDRQTHALPEKMEELGLVARRMPAAQLGEESTPESLLRHLNEHLEHVQEVYERIIHAQQPVYYTQLPVSVGAVANVTRVAETPLSEPVVSNLVRFLDQRAPAFAAAVTRTRLGGTRTAFEHFLEALIRRDDWLRALNQDMVLTGHLLDLFQHSPYFAEQLVRAPDYLEELRAMRMRGHSKMALGEMMPMIDDVAEIRRFFLRQMFRTQAESICLQTPVFQTLERSSALADASIVACYRLALAQVFESHPPVGANYSPWQQMMVVALGRLGMQEFDLGSDADIIFILPDADLPELHFWTRVAEKLVSILGSYTGDGTMFAIDTRLVPNGKGGTLVQSESAFREYFAHKAEAWEGLAYMKARAVTGDMDRATAFLAELQEIDWRRYGQSGRSRKELRLMRIRIEREHGESSPLKNAAGGYYDIDFALMYLRLKSAGIFFKVLNTPQRIEIIEKMGHLEHNDAQFMADAATFYRSVDHGLRLIFGHTEGDLPRSEGALETLTELVKRWVPDHLTDQPLHLELLQIRERTRRLFDRLFEAS